MRAGEEKSLLYAAAELSHRSADYTGQEQFLGYISD